MAAKFKACVASDCRLAVRDVPLPEPGPGEVLVRITCSGCCHSDFHVINGDVAGHVLHAVTIGHEGVGRVVKRGPGVSAERLPDGLRVGIGALYSACTTCRECTEGWESLCSSLKKTGANVDGTLGEYCVATAAFAIPIPESIPSTQAAPILCAGITAYKALKDSGIRPGQTVAITGAAGGLGHLGVQYAKAMGLKVIGIDAGARKMELLRSLDCDHPLDILTVQDVRSEVLRITGGRGADAVLLFAPMSEAFTQAANYAKPRASLMCVALPPGVFELSHVQVTTKALNVKGSFLGTRSDMKEALQFVADGLVRCAVEVRQGLESVAGVLEDLEKGDVAGRVVVEIGPDR